ncbi:MAG: TolC family protein [Oligoflexus sp.]|nr:TolC family protein [Oligoflexus sp.]
MKVSLHRLFTLCLLPLAGSVEAKTISIDEFLNSVRDANQTLKIASITIEAGDLRSTSADIIFSPQFFSQASHTLDKKESANPLAPDKVEATNLSFGIQKLWESGLQSQISYNLTKVNLDQPSVPGFFTLPLALPNPLVPGTTSTQNVTIPNPIVGILPRSEYTEARTQLDLVQPLWKNSEGRDYGLTRESTVAKIAMQQMGERYKVKSLVAQAEYVYWQLALAQEAVRTQEGSIERFRKIKEWAKNRANSQLGDKADLLQADSGLRVKQLELEQAKKDRNALQRVFNTLRGVAGEAIEGDLVPLNSKALSLDKMNVKSKEGGMDEKGGVKRLDVEIAKQAAKLSEIEVEQSREKFKGQLDVFGSVALNSLEEKSLDAVKGSVQADHPTYVVGIKFSTPLDHDIIDRDREGLIKMNQAAKLDQDLKEFNARQDWADLRAQLGEAETRLRLATELEQAQKEKLSYEKQRLSIGRTTTYQILMFEQDYANAQLATIKSKADILGILARLKSFGDAT